MLSSGFATRAPGTLNTALSSDGFTPFSGNVRHFIAESRKRQTLYANLEGSFIQVFTNKKAIEEFVYCTLYYKEGDNPSVSQQNNIKAITDKIILLSQKYMKDEVHIYVIWICCYTYTTNSTRAIPLFKIYKSKSRNTAIYVDVDLKVYDTWNHYIDTANFACEISSFLCVPRNGEYSFVDNFINLEYITKINSKSTQGLSQNNFEPYSQRVIITWILKIKSTCSEIYKGAVRVVSMALSLVKRAWDALVDSKGAVIVFLLRLIIMVHEGGLTEHTIKCIVKDLFMLAHQVVGSGGLQKALESQDVTSKILESRNVSQLKSLKKFVENSSFENSLCMINDFIKSGDWEKCLSIVLRLLPDSPVLGVVIFFAEVFKNVILSLGCPRSNKDKIISQEPMKHRLAAEIAAAAICDKPASSEDKQIVESNAMDMLTDRANDKIISNLDKLNEAPYERIFENFYQESAYEVLQELKVSPENHPLRNFSSSSRLLLAGEGTEDPVVFMYCNSFQEVFQNLKILVKSNAQVKQLSSSHYKVLNSRGEVAGFLFFFSENLAVGQFSREKIAQMQMEQISADSDELFNHQLQKFFKASLKFLKRN